MAGSIVRSTCAARHAVQPSVQPKAARRAESSLATFLDAVLACAIARHCSGAVINGNAVGSGSRQSGQSAMQRDAAGKGKTRGDQGGSDLGGWGLPTRLFL